MTFGVWTIAPEEKCPRLGLVLGLEGDNFPRGKLSQNRKIHFSKLVKLSQIFYIIINLLGHEQICLMRLIEHIH